MELKQLNPHTLKPNKWNSNKVSRPEFEKLKKSLTKHSAFKPVIVRKLLDNTLEILGGFHRNEAAKELGWDTIPVLVLSDVSDNDAREISLIDNTRYGEDDEELLERLLSELDDPEEFACLIPETEDLEDTVSDEAIEELLAESEKEKTDPDHKLFKIKLDDLDKAEEIQELLEQVIRNQDYTYKDYVSNLGDALYYLLVIEK